MNLYEQQAANRRGTWMVMLAFVLFLFVLGLGFDTFYLSQVGGFVPIGSIVALGIGSVSAFVSYANGDKAVLLSTGAVPVAELLPSASESDALKLRQLDNVVEEMAIAAGLPKPAVYVVPDPDPNAFATGRGPGRSSIAVTRGLLDTLDREELQGVIGHEMSHVRNYDIRVMTVVAALVGSVLLLSDWGRRGLWWGGGSRRSRDNDGGGSGVLSLVFFVLWIVSLILAPII